MSQDRLRDFLLRGSVTSNLTEPEDKNTNVISTLVQMLKYLFGYLEHNKKKYLVKY